MKSSTSVEIIKRMETWTKAMKKIQMTISIQNIFCHTNGRKCKPK